MKEIGAITQYIDVAQVALYVFWIFFVLLVVYLHRENKREGYPLRSSRKGTTVIQGFPSVPEPKTYRLLHGGTVKAPRDNSDDARELAASDGRSPGDPIRPTGDCLRDGVGAAAWAERADVPDAMLDGSPRIVPMSSVSDHFRVEAHCPDPRGLRVLAADRRSPGHVTDIWIDRMESLPRYYSVELDAGPTVLLPVMLTRIVDSARAAPTGTLRERLLEREKQVQVASLLADQFIHVPAIAQTGSITLREEDRIMAYYGGGHLHATPERAEPWL